MTLLRTLALLAALAAPAFTQTIEKIPDVVVERELITDADGLKQFSPWELKCEACKGRGVDECRTCSRLEDPWEECPECDGEKMAKCRICVGEKVVPDPLESLVCPACWGKGLSDCGQCVGFGEIKETDQHGNVNFVGCTACKKKGVWECLVCEGEQHLKVLVKKKAPTEAKLKDLRAALESVQEALAYMEAFDPGDERAAKVMKAIQKDLRKPMKALPPLGNMIKTLDEVLAGIHKAGAQYANYEAKLTHRILTYKNRTIYMLRYHERVLELCIERAAHNDG